MMEKTNFALKNKNALNMEQDTLASKVQVFLEMMNEDHIYLCPALDYQTICQLLEIQPQALDAALLENIGHSGKELMAIMKSDYISYIGKKYGLNICNAR